MDMEIGLWVIVEGVGFKKVCCLDEEYLWLRR